MNQFTKIEIEKLFLAMDRHLHSETSVILIGGAAAALAYNVENITRDIDTTNNVFKLKKAYELAKQETGLDIPFGPAPVFDAPYEYESRLNLLPLKNLRKLKLMVPEKHDFVLMKVVRGYEHDQTMVSDLAKNHPLDFEILVARFISEMGHVHGDPKRLLLNFLAMISRIFHEKKAEIAERRIKKYFLKKKTS